ncbi:MAG: flagellar hook-basal body complex protein [Candidatus Eisenbacteria sp.]|nr:flagellar hook-basal body complex protein [Candidatus Eisenbacteria bacterium]
MLGCFYSAVSGVQGHLFSMNVVGNNIANVNTNGFKSGRVRFRETFVQTLRDAAAPRNELGGRSAIQMGLGMEIASVDTNQSQGMLQQTGIVTDLGIDGEGYFVLTDGNRQYYTRSGNFVFDADGYLTSPSNGMIVQGWLAGARGEIPAGAPLEKLQLPFGERVPARATTGVQFSGNLDAEASNSTAELASAGTTGVTSAVGMAVNGAGGQHEVTISGANATASVATGANLSSPGALTGAETLLVLGVTDVSDFTLSVDGGSAIEITGLTTSSTVSELINAINNLAGGVTASLEGGEVKLTRDYAGDGTLYNIASSAAVAGNITRQIFGAGVGSAFQANSGTASTLTATDTFTPTGKSSLASTALTLTIDSDSGLMTGISDVGDGGITVNANSGLAAGTLVIDTEDTSHLTSIIAFDTLGQEHTLNMTFTRTAATNRWYWEVSFDGGESITGGQRGTVDFNSDGSFREFSFDSGVESVSLSPNSGANAMSIDFWAGTVNRFDGVTQFSSPFTTKAMSQDGFGMGDLTSISADPSGKITGLFSNGTVKDMGQVVLAKFKNPEGLVRAGGNLYEISPNSGHAMVGAAGETISAKIVSKSLEMSNVDLSEEFVRMIVAQRGFQANARVITTGDEMLTDLMNLKR